VPLDADNLRILFAQISVFGLIAALWLAALTVWLVKHARRKQQLGRRLHGAAAGEGKVDKVLRLWNDDGAAETVVADDPHRSTAQKLELIRQNAGWRTPMPQVLMWLVGITLLLSILVFLITHSLLLTAATIAVILMGFRAYLLRCVSKRSALFEKQLVDALDLGARSLRAGHPLSGAFKLIAQEIDEPLKTVFHEIVDQESLGVGLQQALEQAAQRSLVADMRIFAASVVIQLRSGGNLADMMDRVSWVIRDRMKLSRRARVLTAEAQLSKWILLALPIGLFLVLNLMNKEYMEPFFNTFAGGLMLLVSGVMLMIGAWIMSRMANLKY
jgi:tight adherence protein B